MAATQDLTLRMIPFLDRHLAFPLIEFLELKEVILGTTICIEFLLNWIFFFIGLRSRGIAPS
jgi:hypothetical protein